MHSMELWPRLATPGGAEVEERILGVTRYLPRLKEELEPYLTIEQTQYVFGALPTATAKFSIELLREFKTPIDVTCVSRICRLLSTLQPALCAVCPQVDAARQVESAKQYYSLLTQSPESIITLAQGSNNYGRALMAVLDVAVVGRTVTAEERQRLKRALSL